MVPENFPQNVAIPHVDSVTPALKRPARIPGFVGTNAAFMIPEHIREKFKKGWVAHIPLTYLTNKGCLLKNKAAVNSTQDMLTFDAATGQVTTISKTLPDHGELDLSFDEWHQAWRRLLELIERYLPEEFLVWEIHYLFVMNSENRAEMWPLYLAYDVEIRKRAVCYPIDPSQFSIGIWNDLEARYTAKKVLSLVQADLKQHSDRIQPFHPNISATPFVPRVPSTSFRNNIQPLSDSLKPCRCIFCGDRSKSHQSRNCQATCYANGAPCLLARQGSSGPRLNRSGKRFCYAWNGPSGCDQNPCPKGDHFCTLCGSPIHTAQLCDTIA